MGTKITRRVKLIFPMERVKDPVIYHLAKDYDLVTNIRRANIEQHGGWVVLEISGEAENMDKGFAYLESLGVLAEPVEGDIVEG